MTATMSASEGAKSHHEMFRRLQEQLAEISNVEFKDIPLGSGDNNDWSNILIWYLTYDHPEYYDDPLARMARGVPFLSKDFTKYYTMLLIQLDMTDLDKAMQHLERSLARFEYKLHLLGEKDVGELKMEGVQNFTELPKIDTANQLTKGDLIQKLKDFTTKFKSWDAKNVPEKVKDVYNYLSGRADFWKKIADFIANIRTNPEALLDYGIVKSSKIQKEQVMKSTLAQVTNIKNRFVITGTEGQQDKAYDFKKNETSIQVIAGKDVPKKFVQVKTGRVMDVYFDEFETTETKVVLTPTSLFQNIQNTTAYINTLGTLIDSYTLS